MKPLTTNRVLQNRMQEEDSNDRVIKVSTTLPAGWKLATLDQVCDIIMGQSPSSQFYNANRKGLPFFQGKAEFGTLNPEPVKWCSAPRKVAKKNDVLISVRAPVGPTNLAPSECCIGRGLAAIRPRNGIPSKYVFYYLRSVESDIEALGTGTTFKAISGKTLRSIPIPVAPADQQKRIVLEIEKQFSRLDEAVAGLKRVKANLKRYKSAVLKAAVEGKLTEQWRKEHLDVEPANKLLEHILAERRKRWERKGKYKEPTAPDIATSSLLPNTWTWATVGELIIQPLCNGISVKGSDSPPGIRALRLSAMSDAGFDYSDARYLPLSEGDVDDLWIQDGDFFISRGNGSLHLVGRGTSAQPPPVPTIFPDTMIRLRFAEEIQKTGWVRSIWPSRLIHSQVERKVKTTAGIYKIAQPQVEQIMVPLPPTTEQQQIVAEVERRLSMVEELEKEVTTNLQRAERLRQSILKQAFSGELLSQRSCSHTGGALYDRIQSSGGEIQS